MKKKNTFIVLIIAICCLLGFCISVFSADTTSATIEMCLGGTAVNANTPNLKNGSSPKIELSTPGIVSYSIGAQQKNGSNYYRAITFTPTAVGSVTATLSYLNSASKAKTFTYKITVIDKYTPYTPVAPEFADFTKKANWTDSDLTKADIKIESAKETSTITGRVLVLGSLCDAHLLTNNTIKGTIEGCSKYAEVDYFLFRTGLDLSSTDIIETEQNGVNVQSAYPAKVSGHLDKGESLDMTHIKTASGKHCTLYDFAEVISTYLDPTKDTYIPYDLIVMEFDGLRMGLHEGIVTEDMENNLLNAAKIMKKSYADKSNKVAWVINQKTSSCKEGKNSVEIAKLNKYMFNDVYINAKYSKSTTSIPDWGDATLTYQNNTYDALALVAPEDWLDASGTARKTFSGNKYPSNYSGFITETNLPNYIKRTSDTSDNKIYVYYENSSDVNAFIEKKMLGQPFNYAEIKDEVAKGFTITDVRGEYYDENVTENDGFVKITDDSFTYEIDAENKNLVTGRFRLGDLPSRTVRMVISVKIDSANNPFASSTSAQTNEGDAVISYKYNEIDDDFAFTNEAQTPELNRIKISYVSEDENKGTVSQGEEALDPYIGDPVGAEAVPSSGYVFVNWTNSAGEEVSKDTSFIPSKTDGSPSCYVEETYTAHFTEIIDPTYTVEYYYQKDDGTYAATPDKTDATRKGTTGETVEVTGEDKTPETVEGKTYVLDDSSAYNTLWSAECQGDSGTVLKVYFKQQYTVTYQKGEHGDFDDNVHEGNDYGVTTPSYDGTTGEDGAPKGEPGYIFAGWSPEPGETVTKNETYVAQWTPDPNVSYTVEYYYQKDDGTYAATPDKTDDTRKGTTGETVEVTGEDKTPETVEGKTYVLDDSSAYNTLWSAECQGDSGTVLKVYFKQQYTVTYQKGEHGDFDDNVHEGNDYGVTTPSYDGATGEDGSPKGEPGYIFAGWSPELGETVTKNETYVAQWTPDPNVSYTVEYYYQKDDGTYAATPDKTDATRKGTTGETVEVTGEDKTPETVEGKTYVLDDSSAYNTLWSAECQGDSGTVLKVYFKQQYTVTYQKGEHGDFDDNVHEGNDYGVTTPSYDGTTGEDGAPKGEPGYIFAGWSPEPGETVTKNETYVAQWTPDTIGYTVQHYLQKVDGGYELYEIDVTHTAETDSLVSATPNTYNGFTYNEDASKNTISGKVKGDGTFVLKVYYDRMPTAYTVNYYLNGTTKKLYDTKHVDGKVFGESSNVEVPVVIDGYTAVSDSSQKIDSLSAIAEENTINFYYYQNVNVIANSGSFEYDGKTHKVEGYEVTDSKNNPIESVVFKDPNAPENDFTIALEKVAAGEYPVAIDNSFVGTVDVTGKYIVTSLQNGTLIIKVQPFNDFTVEDPKDAVYDAEKHLWVPVVLDKDGNVLTKDDYTLEYKIGEKTICPENPNDDLSFINTGKITVVITGQNNFEGTITKEYNITPVKIVIQVDNKAKYKGEKEPEFTGSIIEGKLFDESDLGVITYYRMNNDEEVGKYEGVLTAKYEENLNYEITVVNGNFDILKEIEDPVNTSDSNNIFTWLMSLLISGLSIVVVLRRKRV